MTTLANRVKPWAMDLRSRPLLDYVVILGVVFILSGLGIVMVFSSSMAVSALQDDSPWSRVVRQGGGLYRHVDGPSGSAAVDPPLVVVAAGGGVCLADSRAHPRDWYR